MWHMLKPYAYVFVWLAVFLAGCSATAPATNTSSTSVTLPNSAAVQQAWQETRKALPADLMVYAPTFIPARFSAPSMEEARVDAEFGAVYTVIYTNGDETIAFIRNVGKGAWGNSPPPESLTPVTVNNVEGTLWLSRETHNLGVSWQQQSSSYQVNAHSERMTTDELRQIINSITPVMPSAQSTTR